MSTVPPVIRSGRSLGSIQRDPATPVCLYSSASARCWCGATINLRTDGQWQHPHGIYCREQRGAA